MLDKQFVEFFKDKTPPWGPMGYVIYKRTYARRLPDGRSEEWWETCERVCNGLHELEPKIWDEESLRMLFVTMFYLRGSVSGRALWQLGTDTVRKVGADSLQNCWHVVVNKLEAFTFTFNQLMLGGGVGFNVLPENVYELPTIKYCPSVERVETHDCDFIVPDNREGWVELLKRVLEAFTITGRDVHYDTSCVRAKGKPIKGFGGTASGPEDLVKGIGNIVAILKRRSGQKLRPIDCMDIMNIIGQVVVAGNVRRSSEIALGHYHDFDYLDAKNWAKHQIPNWRVMSNNSVVAETFEQLPDAFWESGYTPLPNSEEVGGEPYGLVNLKNCREFGRLADGPSRDRDPSVMGVNPCVTSDTWVQTHIGPRQVKDLIGKNFKVVVNGEDHLISSDGFVFTGHKEIVEVKTSGFSLKCTPCHRLLTTKGWKEAGKLTSNDCLVLDKSESEWYGDLQADTGWLVGQWVGDGTESDGKAILKWWGEEIDLRPMAATLIKETVGGRTDIGSGNGPTVSSVNLFSVIGDLNLEDKCIGESIESQGSDFYKGFLRGWFDADGHVIYNPQKGSCVRLTSTKLENLKAAQRMLARLGIISTVYENRRDEGYRDLPGGSYWCQAAHDLHISKDMVELFADKIGFTCKGKHHKLMEVLSNRKRAPYKTKFESKVVSVEPSGSQDVYDVTVPGIECFNANGIIAHNCAEITLGDKEPCNLAEVFLPNITSIEEFKDVAGILFKACKTISNAGFSDPGTDAIVQKHHRIGVGLTGCMQAEHWIQEEHLNAVYEHLGNFDRDLSNELGINESIKRTTIKPSGTLSLLPGVTPGMHGALGRYMLRTVRFSADHPLVAICREHGYRVEPKLEMDGSHDHGTMVIYFPIKQEGRLAEEINVLEELEIQKHLQTYWSDNAVSATHYFEPGDVPKIQAWLQANYEDGVKSTSFLRREGHGFKQAPFQPVSKEVYEEELAKVRPIVRAEVRYDGEDLDSSLECAGGNCPVR